MFGLLGDKSRKVGRDSIILLGTIVHLVVYFLCYMNFPQNSSLEKTDDMGGLIEPSLAIALIAGGLLGFGDAVWNTQIYSFLCDTYPKQSAQAFSLFKFYQVCWKIAFPPLSQTSSSNLPSSFLLVGSLLCCIFLRSSSPALLASGHSRAHVFVCGVLLLLRRDDQQGQDFYQRFI